VARVIHCPYCNRPANPNLENCPHCGGFLQRKKPGGPAVPAQDILTCPNCHGKVDEGEIVCLNCGTNLLTGQKIASEAPAASKRRFALGPVLAIGLAVAVLAILMVGFLLWALSGDPVDEALDLARAGDEAGATRVLTEHVEREPADTRAWVELGKLQFRSNPAGAAASFEKAMSNNPYAARMVVLGLADVQGAEARQRQIEALRHLLRLQPDNEDARMLLALTFGVNGEPGRQAEVLREVIEEGRDDWQVRMHLAIAYALQGQLDQARDEVEQALAAEPDSAELHAVRGFIASMAGTDDVAAEHLRSAVTASAAEREVLLQLGVQLIGEGNFSAAEPYLSQALERSEGSEPARFFYAITLQALDREDQALQMYEALVQEGGEFAARAALQAADIFLTRANLDRAREMVETAASRGDNSAAFFTVKGRVEMLADDDAAARDAFRKAIQIDPNYPAAHLENGLLYVKQETFPEAVAELDRYLELVNPEAEDSRADEVAALIEQLRQSMNGQAPTFAEAGTATGSEAL
jgi:Tfp pilus assembly protein PilF